MSPIWRKTTCDVDEVVCPALRQHRGEPDRIDRVMDVHGDPAFAQLDRGRRPVQLHVRRTERRPVMIGVAAERAASSAPPIRSRTVEESPIRAAAIPPCSSSIP